jgi:protein involved in polysaccharide export with SLBB domain
MAGPSAAPDGIGLALSSAVDERAVPKEAKEKTMSKGKHGAMIALALTLVIVTSLAGCASSTPSGPSAFVVPAPTPTQTEYVIQPGDSIDITFYYHPENNQQSLLVRPDGKILLALIGEVQAAGLTTAQLAEEIAQRSKVNLRDPKVSVNVKSLNQTHIFVGGEVFKPGFVSYVPGITAVQAIVQVGGWKDTADLKEVVLLQKISDGSNEYRPSKLNLAKVVEEGDVKADLALGPSDVLVLTKTGIAKANLWMQQYVLNMFPIRISATPF